MDTCTSRLFIDEVDVMGVPTLLVVGDLDTHTSSALRYRIQGLRRQGHHRIGLDLRLVQHLDPMGVSTLVTEHEECRRTRRSLVIHETSREVGKVLSLLGLEFLLNPNLPP